jgi:hypothetical protein
MAELAIPLIALGSMYIMSNQDKKKEKFTNMTETRNYLPNTEPILQNYPILQPVKEDNIQRYVNPNQITDKYFDPSTYEKTISKELKNEPEFVSLTGEPIVGKDFRHNNMAPFFGAKIRGATANANVSESVLDNLQGSGSQQFSKKEVAPLFKPQDNVQWAHGAPNQSDFYQSRVNPSMRMSNIKPWEEQIVGPGLDQGYGTEGALGFNSGMGSREKWMPYTVDEMRVKTNPKVSYGLEGHQGPAINYIKNRGVIGKVEKHLPDKYYDNTPDRWLTTTGIEKAQTARGIEVLQDVSRPYTTQEYFGTRGRAEGEAGYTPQNYEQARREEQTCEIIAAPSAVGQNPASTGDYSRDSYKFLPTNRTTTCYNDTGIVGGVIGAVVAPLLDLLRPTRKENVVGNARPYDNAKSTVPANVVFNPSDRTKTTNREMLVGKLDNNHLNFQNQRDGGYTVNVQQPIDNNRDTTNISYIGSSGGPANQSGLRTYEAEYNQRNNPNKTYPNRPNQGGTQIFNQNECIKIDKLECDRENNRLWVRGSGPTVANALPAPETYGKFSARQYYDENINCERIQPDILNAFKQNPYTQSLNSWA